MQPPEGPWHPLPGGTVVNNRPTSAGFDPWVGKIPWRRKGQPTPVILAWEIPCTEGPGADYSPRSREESEATEHTRKLKGLRRNAGQWFLYLKGGRGFACWRKDTISDSMKQPAHMCVFIRFRRVRFCDPVDCNRPGSSVHGILQARILDWVAMPFSRGSS